LASRISQSPILDDSQKGNLPELLNGFDFGTSLCHGDFHLMNLIKTNQHIVIIDWVDATLGSPEADLCRTYLLYRLHAPKSFADKYLDLYCMKTNKSRDDILKWLPIIAGARLSEKNESEKDLLLQYYLPLVL
jgi:thiamine kinase-like enzyme